MRGERAEGGFRRDESASASVRSAAGASLASLAVCTQASLARTLAVSKFGQLLTRLIAFDGDRRPVARSLAACQAGANEDAAFFAVKVGRPPHQSTLR